MPTLLFINACVRGRDSRTLALAEHLLECIIEANHHDMAFHMKIRCLTMQMLLPRQICW